MAAFRLLLGLWIVSRLVRPMPLARDSDGPHSKPPRAFLHRLAAHLWYKVIGEAHPAFRASRTELRTALEAMLADGLRAYLDDALDGMAPDIRAERHDALRGLLQARGDSLRSALT